MGFKHDYKVFIEFLPELEPQEFIGVLKLLGVKLFQEEEPRSPGDLIQDAFEKFEGLKRKERKTLMKLFKEIKKENVEEKTLVARGHQKRSSEENINGTEDSTN